MKLVSKPKWLLVTDFAFSECRRTLKTHSHPAKEKTKANIIFEVCNFSFELFRVRSRFFARCDQAFKLTAERCALTDLAGPGELGFTLAVVGRGGPNTQSEGRVTVVRSRTAGIICQQNSQIHRTKDESLNFRLAYQK